MKTYITNLYISINKVFIIVIIAFCQGCTTSDPPTEIESYEDQDTVVSVINTDECDLEYSLKKIVYDISDFSDYVRSIDSDTIISIDRDIPNVEKIKLGNIILSKSSTKLPYGFANKVISMTETGGVIRCVTTPAKLDEIFGTLRLQCTSCASMNQYIDSIQGDNGILYAIDSINDQSRTTIGSDEILKIRIKSNLGLDSDNQILFFDGGLKFGLITTINIDLQSNKFECSIKPTIGCYGTFGYERESKITIHSFKSKRISLFSKKNLINGVIEVGPLVLRPYVDVNFDLESQADGLVFVNFDKTYTSYFGFNEGGAFYKNVKNDESSNFLNKLEIDGEVGIRLISGLDFGLGLYTRNIAVEIKPEIVNALSASCYLATDFENIDYNAYLNYDIVGEAGGACYANFFNKDLFSSSMNFGEINFLNLSYPLLPEISDFVTEKTAKNTYDANYTLSGGLIRLFTPIKAGLDLYGDKGKVMLEFDSSTPVSAAITTTHSFKGVVIDTVSMLCPIVDIYGKRIVLDKKKCEFDAPDILIYDCQVSSVTYNSAVISCMVTGLSDNDIVELVYNELGSATPNKVSSEINSGKFLFRLSGLNSGTTYNCCIRVIRGGKVLQNSGTIEFTTDRQIVISDLQMKSIAGESAIAMCSVRGVSDSDDVRLICYKVGTSNSMLVWSRCSDLNCYEFNIMDLEENTKYECYVAVVSMFNEEILAESDRLQFVTENVNQMAAKKIRVQVTGSSMVLPVDTIVEIKGNGVAPNNFLCSIGLGMHWRDPNNTASWETHSIDIAYNTTGFYDYYSNYGIDMTDFFINYSIDTKTTGYSIIFCDQNEFTGNTSWLEPSLYLNYWGNQWIVKSYDSWNVKAKITKIE